MPAEFSPVYALHDQPEFRRLGAQPVTPDQQWVMQDEGYGLFWTPNLCDGRRLADNLSEIRYWYCEVDTGTKEEQLERIRNAPLLPSLVIESKRGYHVYWAALHATVANWKRIVRWGIVPALDADPKATDPVRILRLPGSYHLKDPNDPFLVSVVWDKPFRYTEAQMMRAFPDQSPQREDRPPGKKADGFWGRVAELDGRDAILALSGHALCNGERFELQELSNGNANIFRVEPDGSLYSTGCFVDAEGRLGSVQGGCSIAAWCRWYGAPWAEIAEGLRELYPELGDDRARQEQRAEPGEAPAPKQGTEPSVDRDAEAPGDVSEAARQSREAADAIGI